MTATNLGLGGNPVRFLGAYVINVNSSLGLSQSPSTCNVTLVEDLNQTPQVLFNEPTPGDFAVLDVGANFRFGGIITSWQRDVANIGGRQITVNMSDAREIMKSIPIILAPGFRSLVSNLGDECAYIDAFGAYDDYANTGINLSGWNQAGMTYERIALVFKGGAITDVGFTFNVAGQAPRIYGYNYRFNLDEVTARVDPAYRINSNLISVADFIQELATRHSFDWYIESELNPVDGYIDSTVRVIDRSIDNTSISLDDFLAANSGFVIQASRGYELRNEVNCAVLYGAPVEQLVPLTIEGLANNPVDLSAEGGTDKYFMTEDEMRFVLGGKNSWEAWVSMNGNMIRYSVPGTLSATPIVSPSNASDVANQIGVNPNRFSVATAGEEVKGRLYDKLKGHAESTYGKRFLFPALVDVETIDAAWTSDSIAGNNDPNEFFRNSAGKTRCYVEFSPSNIVTDTPMNGVLGFAGNFGLGLGDKAPQALVMDLINTFNVARACTECDKSDWIINEGKIYIAATIEEGNVVRIDNPVIFHLPNVNEGIETIAAAGPQGSQSVAQGTFDKAKVVNVRRALANGQSIFSEVHGKCFQPTRVFVPSKSKFNRYGPVLAVHSTHSEGRLAIDVDDGFCPWEFGSTSAMLQAMQFKVNNSSSNVRVVENANITVEGFPRMSLGESLGFNSNINNISISFGDQVQTTYELRSFLRQFGELSKEELTLLSLFARRSGGRVLPQDTVGFINKYLPSIYKQFSGKGSRSTSARSGGADNFE